MKVLVFALLVTLAVGFREVTDDFSTTWYRACTTATNSQQNTLIGADPSGAPLGNPFAPAVAPVTPTAPYIASQHGGTACIVYNPTGRALSYTIAHSFNPLLVTAVQVAGQDPIAPGGQFLQNYIADRWAPALPFRPRGQLGNAINAPDPNAAPLPNAAQLGINGFNRNGDLSNFPLTGGLAVDFSNVDQLTFQLTISVISTFDGRLDFQFNSSNLVNNKWGTGADTAILSSANRPFFATAQEGFTPFGTRVLLRRNPRFQSFSSYNDMEVISVGSQVRSSVLRAGDKVWARMEACFTSLIFLGHHTDFLPADNVLANSPYCIVNASDVIGVLGDNFNRAYAFRGHIDAVVGPGAGYAGAFQANFRTNV